MFKDKKEFGLEELIQESAGQRNFQRDAGTRMASQGSIRQTTQESLDSGATGVVL